MYAYRGCSNNYRYTVEGFYGPLFRAGADNGRGIRYSLAAKELQRHGRRAEAPQEQQVGRHHHRCDRLTVLKRRDGRAVRYFRRPRGHIRKGIGLALTPIWLS